MPSANELLRLLRKAHAWVGLCGAAFGVLFGVTGFLQNHRSVMKIDLGRTEERKVELELGEPPATIDALAAALTARLGWDPARVRTRVQAGRPARIDGAGVQAAARWTVQHSGHAHSARAVYSPGNRTVEVELEDAGLLEALGRMHRADAGQRGLILLTDAFAGAVIFLSLSGSLLWTRLAGPRLLAAGLAAGIFVLGIGVASRAW